MDEVNYFLLIPLGLVAEAFLSIWGIILYPFGCAIMTIYRATKTGKPIEDKIFTAIGIIIFLIIAFLWVEMMLISSAPPLPLKDFSP